ncbi:MAG TPA: hypothetical protein VK996_19085, partial [Ramlibacter sp.]|nr:hypothetical protein [Ramlibacter sp.]
MYTSRILVAISIAVFSNLAGAQTEAVDPDAVFKGRMGGTFGKNIIEVMPAAKRIAVAGFKVAFVTNNAVSAQVRGSYL